MLEEVTHHCWNASKSRDPLALNNVQGFASIPLANHNNLEMQPCHSQIMLKLTTRRTNPGSIWDRVQPHSVQSCDVKEWNGHQLNLVCALLTSRHACHFGQFHRCANRPGQCSVSARGTGSYGRGQHLCV